MISARRCASRMKNMIVQSCAQASTVFESHHGTGRILESSLGNSKPLHASLYCSAKINCIGNESSCEVVDLNHHDTSLLIFDKDGTLICFHSMWALGTAKRIELATGLDRMNITNEVYSFLRYCPSTGTVQPGLLAESTMPDGMMGKLTNLLVKHGMKRDKAALVVESVWEECDTSNDGNVKALHNIQQLFTELRSHDVKIAICSADSRKGTESALLKLGLNDLVDIVECEDDDDTKPKPNAYNALKICEALDVEPRNAIMVGGTVADIDTGINAKLGGTIGVLSGVGDQEHLDRADHIVPSVAHIMPVVLRNRKHKQPPKRQVVGNKRGVAVDVRTALKDCVGSDLVRSSGGVARTTGVRRSGSRAVGCGFSTLSSSHVRTIHTDSGDRVSHIIVGAGSAGCVLANRLSEDSKNKVLLVEAGPSDAWWNWKIHMPAALMYNLCDDKYNWFYHTLPQKHMHDRVMYWPRGRVWGGSSALNAMAYVRGHAFDYDRWDRVDGATGWSYASCLPYFKKAQCHSKGGDAYRGDWGPLHVSESAARNPLFGAWMDAGVEAGYGFTEDMNGYRQEGVGKMDMTVYNGRRWSTSQAYLRPALKRNNLSTKTRALVNRIVFDGNKAIGIEITDGSGTKILHADQDIILCGGAINSPQLLQLSGIGDADFLKFLDIPVVQHLPGVGENLQDHLEIYIQQACTQPITVYNRSSWKFPHPMIATGLEWFAFQTGDGASSHLEAGGFVRRDDVNVTHPDVQFHFHFVSSYISVHDHDRKPGTEHAYQVHVGPLRPTSRGYLKIQSKNPRDHPIMDANYLATEQDRQEFRDCIRISRNVFAQPAFDPFRGTELAPGLHVQSDNQIDEFVREKADSAYHPSCTVKMGSDFDKHACIDPTSMKVYGIEGLRVVDSSVMPSIVSGNLNAPTIMLAERASDLIRQRPTLPELHVPVWTHLGDSIS